MEKERFIHSSNTLGRTESYLVRAVAFGMGTLMARGKENFLFTVHPLYLLEYYTTHMYELFKNELFKSYIPI